MPRVANLSPTDGRHNLVSQLTLLAQLAVGAENAWIRRRQEPHCRDPNIKRVAEWSEEARKSVQAVRRDDGVRPLLYSWLCGKVHTLEVARERGSAAVDITDQVVSRPDWLSKASECDLKPNIAARDRDGRTPYASGAFLEVGLESRELSTELASEFRSVLVATPPVNARLQRRNRPASIPRGKHTATIDTPL